MNFIKKNFSKVAVLAYTLSVPLVSFALSAPCNPAGGKLCNPINASSIPALIQTFLEGALRLGLPLIALAIIYSGFLFVAARGNSENLTTAKKSLMYTIIGAAILLGSWAIATLLSNTVKAL